MSYWPQSLDEMVLDILALRFPVCCKKNHCVITVDGLRGRETLVSHLDKEKRSAASFYNETVINLTHRAITEWLEGLHRPSDVPGSSDQQDTLVLGPNDYRVVQDETRLARREP